MSITSVSRKLFNSKDNTNNIVNHGNKHYRENEAKTYFKTVLDNASTTTVSEKLTFLASTFKNFFVNVYHKINPESIAVDNAKTIADMEESDKNLTKNLIQILHESMTHIKPGDAQENSQAQLTTTQPQLPVKSRETVKSCLKRGTQLQSDITNKKINKLSMHEFKHLAPSLQDGTYHTAGASYELVDGQYLPLHNRNSKFINQADLGKIIQDNKTSNLYTPFTEDSGELGNKDGLIITYEKENAIINLYAEINGKKEKIGSLESGRVQHFMHYTHHLYIACELQKHEPQPIIATQQPISNNSLSHQNDASTNTPQPKQPVPPNPEQMLNEVEPDEPQPIPTLEQQIQNKIAQGLKKIPISKQPKQEISAKELNQQKANLKPIAKDKNTLAKELQLKEEVAQLSHAISNIEDLITDKFKFAFVDDKENIEITEKNITTFFYRIRKLIENLETKLNDYANSNDSSQIDLIKNDISELNHKRLELIEIFKLEKIIKQQQIQISEAKYQQELKILEDEIKQVQQLQTQDDEAKFDAQLHPKSKD